MRHHRRVFTVSITAISRLLILRDRLLGRLGKKQFGDTDVARAWRHAIPSGNNVLDAVYVEPLDGTPKAVVLLCHGIGEVVERWFGVQQLLAKHGVASLVFDYSGYGRSTGYVSATQFELDAVEAFALLKKIRPNDPVSILGFSLGSGIAAAIIDKIDAHRLILAGSFTSFRAAARSLGVPAAVTATLPQVWRTDESLKHCRVPVVIVHGARDRMFPVRMAAELAGTCGENAELVVVPDVAHNEPFYRPRMAFWGVIISRLIGEDVAG